jgi:hypothetical protein
MEVELIPENYSKYFKEELPKVANLKRDAKSI